MISISFYITIYLLFRRGEFYTVESDRFDFLADNRS